MSGTRGNQAEARLRQGDRYQGKPVRASLAGRGQSYEDRAGGTYVAILIMLSGK